MKTTSRPQFTLGKSIAAVLLASAAFQGIGYAQLLKIGVSFVGRGNDQFLGINDTAGVVAQQDWNNLAGNTGFSGNTHNGNQFRFPDAGSDVSYTSQALFRDDGAAGTLGTSAVTLSVATNDAWNSDGPTGTANDKLMKGLIKIGAGAGVGASRTLSVNNLPTGFLYNIVAYTTVNNGGVSADFRLSGAATYDTFYITEDNTFDGTFTQGTSTNSGARTTDADYVQWNNVAPTGGGQLDLTWWWQGGGDGAGFAGFQIIQLAPPAGADRFWNVGAGSGTWDNATTNWRSTNTAGASDVNFANTDKANFGDLGSVGGRTVNVAAGGVDAGQLNVTNSAGNDYTIQGGVISGFAPLVKDGAGSLTMTAANTFTGAVTIKHGTVNVTTIGDATTAGNLGKGGTLTLGDTAGANDAVLNYTGSTATVNRTLAVASNGGAVSVSTGGQTLTLGNVSGTGPLTKSGGGNLAFNGAASTFTGNIAVTGGALSTRTIGSGAGTLSLDTGTAFNLTGPGTTTDARTLTLNGNASFGVTDPAGVYRHTSSVSVAPVLTKTGAGRLEFAGNTTFSQLPTIAAGTLALTKEGSISLPAGGVNLGSGARLEVVPGALGAANTVNLNGGALRVGHDGLQAYYWDSGYDQNDWVNRTNSSAFSIGSAHATIGAPAASARTTTAGQTTINFNSDGDGDAPFLSQGLGAVDNIRAVFTGKIRIDSAGDTTFFTTSDDGSAVFIDGQRIVLNNAPQGMTTRQGTVNLSAGLHDIFMYFHEGVGGAGFTAEYTPFGGSRQFIPNSVLLAGDTVDYTATPINVTAPSTIESGAANAQMGALTLPANTLLTVSGSASFAGTTLTGASSHQVEVTGFNANTTLGTLSTATALTKSGNGNLIFAVAPPVGTTIASNGGLVVSMATGGSDPLVSTALTFNGGGFGLSSTGGDATFNNAVSSSTNLTIAAGSFGNSNFAPTSVTFAPASLVAPAGNALTLRVNDQNYTLNVTPQITGTGSVVTEEGTVNLNGGVSNVGGNFTNRIANVTVNGNVSTNALLQEGNFNGLGSNLVTGQLYAGSVTVTGTLNATSITNAGGTMNANGTTTTGSVSVTGGTFNGNAALNVSGALAVSGGTASSNGALSAGSVLVNGTGTLNVRNNAVVAGATTVDAGRTLNLDMGAGNTRNYAGAATIQNQGTLRAASGTTDFGSNAITVQPRTFTGGLVESMNDNAGNADNGFVLGQGRAGQPSTGGIKSGFRLGNDSSVNSTTAWGDNDLWVYTGQFYDADGQFSFAENIDDQTRVRIDGTLVLSNDVWDQASNTNSATNNNGPGGPTPNVGNNYGMGPEGNGWHNIEVRLYNGGGGAGPSGGASQGGGSNWNSGKGFVFSSTGDSGIDANNFAILNDPGDGSVLRVVSGGGFITVEAGAKIAAGSTTGAQFLQLNGDGSPAVFQLNNNGSATASTVDNLRLSGGAPTGSVLLGDNNTLSVGRLVVVDGGALTLGKAAGATAGGVVKLTGVVPGTPGTSISSIGTGSVSVQGGTLLVNAPVTGSGTVSVSLAGTIGGNNNISGPVTANSGGAIAPGDIFGSGFELATLGTGSLTMNVGSALKLDISDSLGYDSLNVTGSLTLANATLEVAHLNFAGLVGDIFYLVNNDGIDAVVGSFLGLSDGDTYEGPGGSQYTISYDATTGGAFDGAGNDIALQLTVVPEPGTFSALLGGFGMLMGMQRFRRRKA